MCDDQDEEERNISKSEIFMFGYSTLIKVSGTNRVNLAIK